MPPTRCKFRNPSDLHAMAAASLLYYNNGFRGLARLESDADPAVMADRDDNNFRIKPGRSRVERSRVRSRDLSFISQVKIAVRKAGGTPNRADFGAGSASHRNGGESGRFNARGRGAKVMASIPRNGGGWQRDSAGRFRSRRVVVKAHVVRLASSRADRAGRRCAAEPAPGRWTLICAIWNVTA